MIKKIKSIFGLDKAILYSSGARLIQSAGSLITLLFIFQGLSLFEQGYFFTFSSILALRLFFELGINNIIIQFTAHESSKILFNSNCILIEKEKSSKLFSIFHLISKYYPRITAIFLAFLYFIGYIYFDYENHYEVSWELPWLLICFNSGLNFFIAPYFSFFEGLGHVKQISFFRLLQTIITLLITWTLLYLDARLYAVPVGSIIALIIVYLLFYMKYRKVIYQCIHYELTERISYIKEIFPLQWKLAISWISGYFIFQLFNPLLFTFSGPGMAAKMGTTLAILNSILFVSISWIQTKTPKISKLIAQKKYTDLDNLFDTAIKQSGLISMILSTIFVLIVYLIDLFKISIMGLDFSGRFINPISMAIISLSFVFNNLLGGVAIYLRSHKVEPLMSNSIVFAILTIIGCTLSIKYFGINEMLLCYLIVSFSMTIWGLIIFKDFKKKYHI